MIKTFYPGLSNQLDPSAEDWLQSGGIYDFSPRKHDRAGFENTLEGMVEKGYSRLAQDRAPSIQGQCSKSNIR